MIIVTVDLILIFSVLFLVFFFGKFSLSFFFFFWFLILSLNKKKVTFVVIRRKFLNDLVLIQVVVIEADFHLSFFFSLPPPFSEILKRPINNKVVGLGTGGRFDKRLYLMRPWIDSGKKKTQTISIYKTFSFAEEGKKKKNFSWINEWGYTPVEWIMVPSDVVVVVLSRDNLAVVVTLESRIVHFPSPFSLSGS